MISLTCDPAHTSVQKSHRGSRNLLNGSGMIAPQERCQTRAAAVVLLMPIVNGTAPRSPASWRAISGRGDEFAPVSPEELFACAPRWRWCWMSVRKRVRRLPGSHCPGRRDSGAVKSYGGNSAANRRNASDPRKLFRKCELPHFSRLVLELFYQRQMGVHLGDVGFGIVTSAMVGPEFHRRDT
jgi:hypothetical protein